MYAKSFINNHLFTESTLKDVAAGAVTKWEDTLKSPLPVLQTEAKKSWLQYKAIQDDIMGWVVLTPLHYPVITQLLEACVERWATFRAQQELLGLCPAVLKTNFEEEVTLKINNLIAVFVREAVLADQQRQANERVEREQNFRQDHPLVFGMYGTMQSNLLQQQQVMMGMYSFVETNMAQNQKIAQDWAEIAQTSNQQVMDYVPGLLTKASSVMDGTSKVLASVHDYMEQSTPEAVRERHVQERLNRLAWILIVMAGIIVFIIIITAMAVSVSSEAQQHLHHTSMVQPLATFVVRPWRPYPVSRTAHPLATLCWRGTSVLLPPPVRASTWA